MIRDALLCFSGVPSSSTPAPTTIIPASATTTLMPNVVDTSPLGLPTGSGGGSTSLPNAGRDLGIGGEMWLQVLLATVLCVIERDLAGIIRYGCDYDPCDCSVVFACSK